MGLILLTVNIFRKCFKRLLTPLMRQQSSPKDIILFFPVFLVEISEAGFKDLCCKGVRSHKAHPWWKTLAVSRHAGRAEGF